MVKKTKVFIFLILFSFFELAAQSGKAQFQLNGNVNGIENGLMYLSYSNGQKRILDSAKIINGKFSFNGLATSPTMAYLSLKESKRDQNNAVGFFIEPSIMKVSLTPEHFRNAKFYGSKIQDEYFQLNKKKAIVEARWNVVMDTLTEVNKRSNFEYQALKDWVLTPYQAEMRDMDMEFFTKHPQSYITAFMLRFYTSSLSLDSLQMFYNKLGKNIQQSEDGKSIAAEIKKIKNGSPGSMAPDFTTIDINDKKLSLSEFKGKYVLLDFWASWCLPCRKGNPHLKELYSKYKEKGFEVIGISDDDSNPAAWHKAVQQDGLPWLQVLRGFDIKKLMNNEPNPNDISNKFGISSLPTRILINPEGVIIGRYSEVDGPLDAKLVEIFKS